MADVSKQELETHIREILKHADLFVITSRKIRQALEGLLSCDLTPRRLEIDRIVMNILNDPNEPFSDDEPER